MPFYGYNGEEHNPETQLQYLRARYYAPNMATFTTEDTFGGILELTQTLNRYAYAGGNPVNFADPSGNAYVKQKVGNKGKIGSNYTPPPPASNGYVPTAPILRPDANPTGKNSTFSGYASNQKGNGYVPTAPILRPDANPYGNNSNFSGIYNPPYPPPVMPPRVTNTTIALDELNRRYCESGAQITAPDGFGNGTVQNNPNWVGWNRQARLSVEHEAWSFDIIADTLQFLFNTIGMPIDLSGLDLLNVRQTVTATGLIEEQQGTRGTVFGAYDYSDVDASTGSADYGGGITFLYLFGLEGHVTSDIGAGFRININIGNTSGFIDAEVSLNDTVTIGGGWTETFDDGSSLETRFSVDVNTKLAIQMAILAYLGQNSPFDNPVTIPGQLAPA